MPATGGMSPGPMRTGGGDGGSGAPLLQRVFESIASARGSAYDQTVSTPVGVENMAYARAITYDVHGANDRLVNNFFPSSMTAVGLLPRWERILGVPPFPGDSETARRARVAAAWAAFGRPNWIQPVSDALAAALGPIYVGLLHQTTSDSVTYWPGGTPNAISPWYSTIMRINVEVTPAVLGFRNPDGTLNAAFYAAISVMGPVLDQMLPAWVTFQWFVLSSHGTTGFYLDEPDLDLEIFDV